MKNQGLLDAIMAMIGILTPVIVAGAWLIAKEKAKRADGKAVQEIEKLKDENKRLRSDMDKLERAMQVSIDRVIDQVNDLIELILNKK